MKYPEEFELMAVFETEPVLLDRDVLFHYNKSTYKYINREREEIIFSITPYYNEVKINVSKENFEIASLSFQNIISFSILSDNRVEKRIMLTGENYALKVQLKPKYSIQFTQGIEN